MVRPELVKIDGGALRDLRERAGLTQDQLAALVGVSEMTISHYERDTRRPPRFRFYRLTHALGVSPDHLLASGDTEGAAA